MSRRAFTVVRRLLAMFEAGQLSESRLALCLEAYEAMAMGAVAGRAP